MDEYLGCITEYDSRFSELVTDRVSNEMSGYLRKNPEWLKSGQNVLSLPSSMGARSAENTLFTIYVNIELLCHNCIVY